MTFTNIVRGVAIESFRAIKSPDGIEHYFILTETGHIIYVRPDRRLVRNVIGYTTENSAFQFCYSYTKNAAYFFMQPTAANNAGNQLSLIQFELDTLKVKTFDVGSFTENYVNNFRTTSKAVNVPHYVMSSTDGDIWFATTRINSVPNMVKFDTTTEEFSTQAFLVDPEVEFKQGFAGASYYELSVGPASLHGVYTGYRMTDDYVNLTQTIIDEYEASGLTVLKNDRFSIILHWEDRDIASPTRRVVIHNGSWRIVDLKSITNQIISLSGGSSNFNSALALNNFVDNLGAAVDMTTFNLKSSPSFDVATGTTTASFDMSLFYARTQFVGRFPYQLEARAANSQYFNFAYSPTTGLPLYPNSFNKNTQFLITPRPYKVYWANMPMAQGFSGSNEYVLFQQNTSGQWGYYRPDTEAFTLYDPTVNPSGYSLIEVDLNDPDDPNGLGFYCTLFTENESTTAFLDQTWIKAPGFKSAINPEIFLEVNPVYSIAKLGVEFTPDYLSDIVLSDTVEGVFTSVGNISSGVEVGTGEFVFGGSAYTGISVGKDVAGDYVSTGFFSNRSLYTSAVFNGRVMFGGYLGRFDGIDFSDIDNPVYYKITWSINQYVFSMAPRPDAVIATGVGVRRPGYENNYMKFGYVGLDFIESRFPNLPKTLDVIETINLRNAVGLSNAEYDNETVHTALKNYSVINGLTWEQTKALFTSTTPYKTLDVVTYGNVGVVQLTHNGISGLYGIEIYEDISGVGTTIDNQFGRSTHYPKLLWFEKAALDDLVEADYKLIEIQALGYANGFGIAMFATDTYVCCLFNEGTNLVARCFLKTALASAAASGTPITTIDKTITIPKGTTGGSWGNLQNTGTNPYRRIGFGVGDDLYVTISATAIAGVALKLDIVAETWEVFMTASDVNVPTTMTYNSITDNVLATRGTTAKLFTDISLATLPLTY